MTFDDPFNEQEREVYLLSVYAGAITANSLDINYHLRVGGLLEEGVFHGFGGNDFGVLTPEAEILYPIRQNIWQFSAAKQYQQVRILSSFVNVAGEVTDFSDFKKVAENVFDTFNKAYLKTEFDTAVGQSQIARQWATIQNEKATFKYLRYITQKDGRVRDEHAELDGITLPVDHPFWRYHTPKNGWNCRCFLAQFEEAKETDLSGKEIPPWGSKEMPELFKMNPGIDKYIFDPTKHPYFKVARGDKGLKDNNFNLYSPQ
jgi:SPP1 gp7 family putative phage head morphogenesis protein